MSKARIFFILSAVVLVAGQFAFMGRLGLFDGP
jgi:hypothetical protein